MENGKYALFGIFMVFFGAIGGAMIEHGAGAICQLGLKDCQPSESKQITDGLMQLVASCQEALANAGAVLVDAGESGRNENYIYNGVPTQGAEGFRMSDLGQNLIDLSNKIGEGRAALATP